MLFAHSPHQFSRCLNLFDALVVDVQKYTSFDYMGLNICSFFSGTTRQRPPQILLFPPEGPSDDSFPYNSQRAPPTWFPPHLTAGIIFVLFRCGVVLLFSHRMNMTNLYGSVFSIPSHRFLAPLWNAFFHGHASYASRSIVSIPQVFGQKGCPFRAPSSPPFFSLPSGLFCLAPTFEQFFSYLTVPLPPGLRSCNAKEGIRPCVEDVLVLLLRNCRFKLAVTNAP